MQNPLTLGMYSGQSQQKIQFELAGYSKYVRQQIANAIKIIVFGDCEYFQAIVLLNSKKKASNLGLHSQHKTASLVKKTGVPN